MYVYMYVYIYTYIYIYAYIYIHSLDIDQLTVFHSNTSGHPLPCSVGEWMLRIKGRKGMSIA